jgi:hypothetical protein
MRRLPNIFESIEYAPGPRRKSAIITSAWRENSKALIPFHSGQQLASKRIESKLAIGVKTPQRSMRLVKAKATIHHGRRHPSLEL